MVKAIVFIFTVFMFSLLIVFSSCGQLGIHDESELDTEMPLVSRELKIWTVGDSITNGTNNGYRNRLWDRITAPGNSVDFLGTLQHSWPIGSCPDPDHDGHSGWTISNIAGSIDDFYSIIGPQDPEIMLIMLGTNDLAWWVSKQEFVDGTDDRMMDLVEHVFELDSDIVIIVGTIPPMSSREIEDTNVDRALYAEQYNRELTEKVMAHSLYLDRLFLADICGALELSDLSDGIHPTRGGYDLAGDAWADIVAGYLNLMQ